MYKKSTEGKISTVGIIAWSVAVIIIIGFIYYASQAPNSGSSNESAQTISNSVSNQNPARPADAATNVALKSKCSEDGRTFYKEYYNQFTQVKSVWFDPQFHFNSKLNTCLVYIQWNDTSVPTTFRNNMLEYTQIITNNNIVYDVYSNEAILQNETVRTNNGSDGKVQETDTLSTYPYAQNIPNSSITDFNYQLHILMSQ